MKAYSIDIRQRVVDARGNGFTVEQVAERFAVSVRTVIRYCQQHRALGHLNVGQHGGHRKSRLRDHDETLRQWIADDPGLTIEQLRLRIAEQLGIKIGYTALWHRLDGLGLSYKKNAARRRAGSA